MTHDDDRDDRYGRDEAGPVDLTPLWPDRDAPERWAALVARIETAAAPELARRSGRLTLDGVVAVVARFAAPALVAAAAAIAVAIGASRQGEGAGVAPAAGVVATAQALSEATVQQALRGADDTWIAGQRAPSVDDLLQPTDAGDQAGDQE